MLRLATRDDAVAVHEIYAPLVAETHISFEVEVPPVEAIADRIAATGAADLPWIVDDAGKRILGYAFAAPHRPRAAYRWTVESSLFVHAERKRKGIGRELYRALLDTLHVLGYRNALAVIALPNTASVALHERIGFTRVGIVRSAGFKLDRWHDVGWWALRMGETPEDPSPPLTIAEASARPEWGRALGQPARR